MCRTVYAPLCFWPIFLVLCLSFLYFCLRTESVLWFYAGLFIFLIFAFLNGGSYLRFFSKMLARLIVFIKDLFVRRELAKNWKAAEWFYPMLPVLKLRRTIKFRQLRTCLSFADNKNPHLMIEWGKLSMKEPVSVPSATSSWIFTDWENLVCYLYFLFCESICRNG